ncbi:6470_t:CDS:2, partial [Gigaspora margarita]
HDHTRLSISKIKKELDQRNLNYNNEENKTNLICLLKANIQQKISNMIKGKANGWALKKNKEYEKRGRDKYITETVKEILKTLFHTSDKDKSKRYMAKEMLQDLQQKVQTGELEADEILQLKTIKNWISWYSSLYKKEVLKEAKAAVLSQKNIK